MDEPELDQVGIQPVLKEDDTPQPLRINKQTKQPSLVNPVEQPAMASELMYGSQNLNQNEMPPSRSASLRKSQTEASLLNRSSTTSSSRSSNGTFGLVVQKHRTAASQRTPASSHPPVDENTSGEVQISTVKRNYQSKKNKANMNKAKGPNRAITTGSILPKELPSPFNDGPLIPVAPTPLAFSNRPRAMTADEPYEKTEFEALGQYPEQITNSRQPTHKRRLFSRVVHGFTSRQNAVMGHEQTIRVSSEKAAGPHDEIFNQSQSAELDKNIVLSDRKITNTEMEIENTLASFPSPPHPHLASLASQDPALAGVEVRGSPFMAEHVAVVSAEINAVAEVDKLYSEDAQSIFVAIEIRGTLNMPNDCSDNFSELSRLDVVVIIDNSLFASSETLMASCETARHIGSLLDMKGDRMAIVATSPLHSNGSHSTTILELNTVNMRKIRSSVDTIVGSSEHPELDKALNHARNLLTESTDRNQTTEHGQGYFGHVFLITSNCAGVSPNLLNHRRLHIHVVSPGSIPWKIPRSIDNNGWNLRSMHRSQSEYIKDTTSKDTDSLFSRLQNVILQARGGIITGKLTDLVLEIGAGTDCSIEGVIGRKKFASLRPGEAITALVKVKVGSSLPLGNSVSSLQASNPPLNSNDLLDQLNAMLGASSFTILTAKLRYNHSLFPSGTRCSIVAEGIVKKQIPGAKWDEKPSGLEDLQATESRISVQKRLVFHLATHQSPRNAISTLRNHFGDAGDRSVCPRYIKLVVKELNFQARVLERLRSSRISEGISENDSISDGPYEHFGEGLFEIPDFKPLEWIPESLDEFDAADADSDEPELTSRYSLIVTPNKDPFSNQPKDISNQPKTISKQPKNISKQPKDREWMRDTLIQDDFSENYTIVEGQSSYVLNAPPKAATTNESSFNGSQSRITNSPREKRNLFENVEGKFSPSSGDITSSGYRALSQNDVTRDNYNSIQSPGLYDRNNLTQGTLLAEHNIPKLPYRGPHHLKTEISKENIRPFHEPSTDIRHPKGPKRKPSYGETRDDAHQIWDDMRQMSRGESQRQLNLALASGAKVIIAKDEEERIRMVRELAIRSQRSLGAETLRGFTDRGVGPKPEREWWVRD